jgi:hypothetical protein
MVNPYGHGFIAATGMKSDGNVSVIWEPAVVTARIPAAG